MTVTFDGEKDLKDYELISITSPIFSIQRLECSMLLNEWCKDSSHGLKIITLNKKGGAQSPLPSFLYELITIETSEQKIQIEKHTECALLQYSVFNRGYHTRRIMYPCKLLPLPINIEKIAVRPETEVASFV